MRAEAAAARSAAYWLLADLFLTCPDEAFVARLRSELVPGREPGSTNPMIEELTALRDAMPADAPAQSALAVEYTRLFGSLSKSYGPPPPYELVHRGSSSPTDVVVAVSAFYADAGLAPIDQAAPPDHLGVELQILGAAVPRRERGVAKRCECRSHPIVKAAARFPRPASFAVGTGLPRCGASRYATSFLSLPYRASAQDNGGEQNGPRGSLCQMISHQTLLQFSMSGALTSTASSATVVKNLQEKGVMVGGVLQEAEFRPDGCCARLNIVDIRTGKTERITQDRGRELRGCKLDPRGLAAISHCITDAIDADVDLVIINKFGRAESEGDGLLCASRMRSRPECRFSQL